jgi:N-acetylneuraminic acid mutarotase
VDADGFTDSGPTGDTEGYSAAKNSWTSLASDPTARALPCYGTAKGSLFVAGGANFSGNAISTNESFKLTKNKWTTLGSIPQAVTDAGSAVYKNVLYCFGGGSFTVQFNGTVYSNVQIYQP